ncbi:MAG TPA: tRNA modification GTPase [Pirellulaceae bacterium]|nr:tRNA modification GTPase [Pirellulaceae bacterium]
MHFDVADTIAAIASASGGAARGIIRLSGPDVVATVAGLFQPDVSINLAALVRPQRIVGSLQLGAPLGEVPCDLLLWPTSRSYTQQPSAELHTLGSPPILNAALTQVCARGARLAGPGEFTLRAFLAGRLDLTQAEAVLGVIDAGSQQELAVALNQLAGGLHGPLHALRNQLLDLLAHLEAGLDFVDEEIEFISAAELLAALATINEQLTQLALQMQTRQASAHELRIVLHGEPNVGKSSLLNALANEQVAIVSEIAGTTRDYVTRSLKIDGLKCQLIDTAGIGLAAREINSPDALAEHQVAKIVAQAHLVLFCLDPTRPLTAWEHATLASRDERFITLFTKADRCPTSNAATGVHVSSLTGAGLQKLRSEISERLRAIATAESQVVAGTAVRCRDSVRLAADCIARAQRITQSGHGEELVAAELRIALDELGRVVGAVYNDDVLDRIFSRFCIGK